jgi:tRNA1(Val) A37 N6-methylase TrmN6
MQENSLLLDKNDINNYGIIYTPNNLVNAILDLIPNEYFKNPNLRWLDIGAGTGSFSINLYNRLLNNLINNFSNIQETKNHIIKNMIYMVEIYPNHITYLKKEFTNEANILNIDFLALNINNNLKYKFDFIIGNPPYNINGKLKTPTNNNLKKSDTGKQVYVDFVYKSFELLKPHGFLNIIIPSLWLKPDKANLYNFLTNKKIHKLVCLSTTQTQKAFNYKAQTPTCYFLIENNTNQKNIIQNELIIYDDLNKDFINYTLKTNFPIPINGINIVNNLLKYVNKVGHLKVYKSSTLSKKTKIENNYNENFQYINIKTTILSNNDPQLVINYSNIAQQFINESKLILANKMYGFPFYDISGTYGISSRDNYIILEKDYSKKDLLLIQAFLSTKTALFIFSTTNYRMRYLERYAFQFIPNINKIPNFPDLLNINMKTRDKLIQDFFNYSQSEREKIEKFSKNYNFFI